MGKGKGFRFGDTGMWWGVFVHLKFWVYPILCEYGVYGERKLVIQNCRCSRVEMCIHIELKGMGRWH